MQDINGDRGRPLFTTAQQAARSRNSCPASHTFSTPPIRPGHRLRHGRISSTSPFRSTPGINNKSSTSRLNTYDCPRGRSLYQKTREESACACLSTAIVSLLKTMRLIEQVDETVMRWIDYRHEARSDTGDTWSDGLN